MTTTETTIKASELRLGNRVVIHNPIYAITQIVTVFSISQKEVIIFDGTQTIALDIANILPVPLTTEILEKCGFVKHSYLVWSIGKFDIGRKNNNFYFCIYNSEGQLDDEIDFYDIYHDKKTTYLHQLQNLYFELIGEELQVNL